MLTDHDCLISMLQQRSAHLENTNEDLKTALDTMQQRHEKAVREMQFFRHKYEKMSNEMVNNGAIPPTPTTTISNGHRSISNMSNVSYGSELSSSDSPHNHHALPPPPPPSTMHHHQHHHRMEHPIIEDFEPTPSDYTRQKSAMASRSTSTTSSYAPSSHWSTSMATSMTNASSIVSECAPLPPPSSSSMGSNVPPPHSMSSAPSSCSVRTRQTSSSTSAASIYSSTTSNDSQSIYSNGTTSNRSYPDKQLKHQSNTSMGSKSSLSWQYLRHSSHSTTPSTSSTPTSSSSVHTTGSTNSFGAPHGGVSGANASSTHSVPMTPVRSSTTTSGYTGHSLIQQRRVDPLIFGGADGLWDTIAKSKGSDVTVEKIISNFLRRGGSPNTAKQQSSSSSQIVKSGYGLIHALIVTKAPGSLDLLLQQGANPNAMTLSTVEDEKCSPCYLAAKVGWLAGLQKLVQAGGDLLASRGGGNKNKTVLHVAAEHCHAAVVEYIVQVTQGELNNQVDTHGATVLHYACASGHTDLVSLLARSCQIPVLQADYQGELPLHWAVRNGRLEVVTLLIERFGLDHNAYVPKKVGTPLDLAKSAGHKRLVDYLKGLGALTAKKMDKRREEELSNQVPGHFESTLLRHGLFADADGF
ncbi:unnamed protein product [Absidia cylindrospora]